jgi:RNA polymerase sigma-70 factor, ECF subfamily
MPAVSISGFVNLGAGGLPRLSSPLKNPGTFWEILHPIPKPIFRDCAMAQLQTSKVTESAADRLLARARDRDEAAIRSIMQSNNRRLYRLARGILRNDSEAEDVVQETYVRAFTHLDSFRGDSSLATWLARIAMNEALGRVRGQRHVIEWTSLPAGVIEAQIIPFPLSASLDPEKAMAQREIQAVVEHAIDELPEDFRLVFISRVVEAMSVEETAEILALKPQTVKTRLHRARAMLRENVERKIGPVVMEAFPFAGKRCERLTEAVIKRLGLSA